MPFRKDLFHESCNVFPHLRLFESREVDYFNLKKITHEMRFTRFDFIKLFQVLFSSTLPLSFCIT